MNAIVSCELGELALVKTEPLSVTMVSGRPWIANKWRRYVIVTLEVADDTGCTSNHLEWASTMTRNIFPINGPA